MIKRILKFAVLGSAAIVVVLGVGIASVKSYGDARYFRDHPATALNPEVEQNSVITEPTNLFGVEMPRNYRRIAFSIEARPGDRVPCVLTQPIEFDGPLPTIIFVHGAGQNKGFLDRITSPFNEAGFAMVSFDQWGQGDRRLEGGRLERLAEWRERGWKSVHDTQRIVDYLLTRDDVDPDRLYIVGASYGSMVSTHVLAQDKRFDAGILLVGGGDFRIMADAPIFQEEIPGALRAVLKPAFVWVGKAFDPIYSAPHTGPIPVLKQCGSADRLVSPESGKALFAALGEPKELRWYDIDHPGLRQGDGPEIIRMLDDGLAWLAVHAGIPVDDLPVRTETASLPSQ
jgi:poly(3-hydroxybutyrate) depolymerase